MCIEFFNAESGEEAVPCQQLGVEPKPGDIIAWGSGDFQITDGPRKFLRNTVGSLTRWIIRFPVYRNQSANRRLVKKPSDDAGSKQWR